MTKCSHWLGASALAWFVALSACGTKGGAGGSGNDQGVSSATASACLGQLAGANCGECLQSTCASALGAFGNDCGDYIDCYCPNGQYSVMAQTSQACISKITSNPSCLSSAQGINNCLQQSCASACTSTGNGSGSNGSGSGGGSSGGVTAACGISFVGTSCASCVQSKCCSVTQTCAQDMACVNIITCVHGCNSVMSCEENCISNASKNAQAEVNAAASCWAQTCGSEGC